MGTHASYIQWKHMISIITQLNDNNETYIGAITQNPIIKH